MMVMKSACMPDGTVCKFSCERHEYATVRVAFNGPADVPARHEDMLTPSVLTSLKKELRHKLCRAARVRPGLIVYGPPYIVPLLGGARARGATATDGACNFEVMVHGWYFAASRVEPTPTYKLPPVLELLAAQENERVRAEGKLKQMSKTSGVPFTISRSPDGQWIAEAFPDPAEAASFVDGRGTVPPPLPVFSERLVFPPPRRLVEQEPVPRNVRGHNLADAVADTAAFFEEHP